MTFSRIFSDQTLSILLADDDEDDREMFQSAVAQISGRYKMLMARSGQAALELLNLLSPDELPCLIVLDVNMIGMDGLQTLKAINKSGKYEQIPKVIFTTTLSHDNALKCLALGAAAFFIKPARMEELIRDIKKMLDYCHSTL